MMCCYEIKRVIENLNNEKIQDGRGIQAVI